MSIINICGTKTPRHTQLSRTHLLYTKYKYTICYNFSALQAFTMTTIIKAHILFTHGHHIEVLLERQDGENTLFYSMNRWKPPRDSWETDDEILGEKPRPAGRFKKLINRAEESYNFTIETCPVEIINDWKKYHKETESNAFIFGQNCAVATQRFLDKYAKIPAPKYLSAPFQLNQIYYYVHWPSFFPAFALIPHKVFHNGKFHIEARNRNTIKESYAEIHWRMAINALFGFGSIAGIMLASKYLSKSLNTIVAPILGWVGINKSLLLFADMNLRTEKDIVENGKSVSLC